MPSIIATEAAMPITLRQFILIMLVEAAPGALSVDIPDSKYANICL